MEGQFKSWLATMLLLGGALGSGCTTQQVAKNKTACTGMLGWTDGQSLQASRDTCSKVADYQEAWRLGQEAAAFARRIAALDAQISSSPDRANLLSREQRQVQNDLEAIRAVAVVQGWLPAQDCSETKLCDPPGATED